MDVFLRIDINLAAITLLVAVCLIAVRRLDLKDHLNRVYLVTSIVIVLEMLIEALTCVLNRRTEIWAGPLSQLLHVLLFSCGPILTYLWYRMLSTWISPDLRFTALKQWVLLFPVFLNLVLALFSPRYGLIFYIGDGNVYHRGPFFVLSMAIVYSYFLLAFILIWRRRKLVVKEEFMPLVVVGILPLIGGVFQSLFYGALLMWSCAGFSLVLVYIFLQQRMVHIDDLTGAWTRSTFENSIVKRAKNRRDSVFGLIFLDVDGLKQINDQHGHLEGDYALKTTVELIKRVLRKSDVIARTGGDEFLIILDCESMHEIDTTISRIKATLRSHNETSNKEYQLDCSMGAELFHSGFEDLDQFMRHVDMLMYDNKKLKKEFDSIEKI